VLHVLDVVGQVPILSTLAALAPQAAVQSPADLKVWAYAIFIGLVLVFLALDLGVFHRHAHEVKMKEAITWSAIWLTLGVAFTGVVYLAYENHWLGLGLNTPIYSKSPDQPLIVPGTVDGLEAAKQYLTGYVVEKSLAMDNIFVIAMIFSFFAIPAKYQHRVLFWGIIGALIMRGGMILLGGELIIRYQWILIVFGLFLILTAVKMAVIKSSPTWCSPSTRSRRSSRSRPTLSSSSCPTSSRSWAFEPSTSASPHSSPSSAI
jgi:TerC family integral membrane protein